MGLGHGRAVGDQVNLARDNYGATGVASERHGGIAGGINGIGGVDTAGAAEVGCLTLKVP